MEAILQRPNTMQTITADPSPTGAHGDPWTQVQTRQSPCTYPHICWAGRAGTVMSISQAGRLGLRASGLAV